MITFTSGNLLESKVDALVNTVNTVGVMGKGIALMFKEAYPENFQQYSEACKNKKIEIGSMFVTETNKLFGPKWIINFPTKQHWRNPSKLEWVEAGLRNLCRVIEEKKISSIAIPPLGSGNGGLDWQTVKKTIERSLSGLTNVNVIVYEPSAQYQNVIKPAGVEELTPARALIVELVRRYHVLGFDCTLLEIQKLAWFLERAIVRLGIQNPLDLRFEANRFGPYAKRLRHLLNALDGSYLHCKKRLSDAGPMDTISFDNSKKETLSSYLTNEECQVYMPALMATVSLIEGFESPLGMEALATTDWMLARMDCPSNLVDVKKCLSQWPGGKKAAQRKLQLFDDALLVLALKQLNSWNSGSNLN
jgi:Predicted phosphatase homologous to the C-terminal domain of histone macroH2A1